jgi:transcriptional regulator NrdR family protein
MVAPTSPPKGFSCPNCRDKLKVLKTRSRASGQVSRRRECPGCGLRISTIERPTVVQPVLPVTVA